MTRLYQGDALQVLPTLAEASVHLCVTSPPFFNLRRYAGVEPSAWPEVSYAPMPGLPPLLVPAVTCCLGNEPTPEAYVGHLVLIFREVWRVLRGEATCWVNLGDSYANGGRGGNPDPSTSGLEGGQASQRASMVKRSMRQPAGVKPKDLLLVPQRFALAAQADGWYVRQVISWQKVAPMPQSCRDRPTTATEELFLLSKRPDYYYDREACAPASAHEGRKVVCTEAGYHRSAVGAGLTPSGNAVPGSVVEVGATRNLWNWWDVGEDGEGFMPPKLRWLLAAEPTKLKHYAAFPGEIPLRAIKLGTSAKGCCPCGAPWVRQKQPSERYAKYLGEGFTDHAADDTQGRMQNRGRNRQNRMLAEGITCAEYLTTGWRPSCACPEATPTPCIVLDCFAGSGTVGVVARALGRAFVGVEASAEYAEMARRRIAAVNPLLDHEDAIRGRPADARGELFAGREGGPC